METIHQGLHPLDWSIVIGFLVLTIAIGLYFTRRAGKNIDSFYVSGRSLPWYLAGVSMIATSFASDTPLWVTSLVRQYGVYYIWQYWAPAIGATLAIVLFARLWRRTGILTDVELVEVRYSGRSAAVLRFWLGFSSALLFCPLIIGWVTKAMEVITREAMGLPPEYRVWTTIIVIAVALVACMLSGLWGVVYTDFFQFILATAGTLALAAFSVREVGGLGALINKLQAMNEWPGRGLNITPSIGHGADQMSPWNAIGYFGILWIGVALSGGYQAQRLLACKDARHSTFAMLLHSTVYYSLVCWPWIVVALCSMVIFPDLGEGIDHDAAYPRMLITLLPVGLRGVLIVAMLAAFMSTISTMFNWGSSYLINDVYKRFLVRNAPDHHYVVAGRLATLLMACAGGLISFLGENIQQLLTISYVVGSGMVIVAMLRWFWWRQNALGELTGTLASWIFAPLLLFAGIFDEPVRSIFHIETDFSSDPNLLGARMLFIMTVSTLGSLIVSLSTRPTEELRLEGFLMKARPFHFFWKPVIQRLGIEYHEPERFGRTLISWALAALTVYSLLFGIGKILLGSWPVGVVCLVVFAVALLLTIRRVDRDFGQPTNE